jgi:iron complex outermembrane recepter protein
MRIFKNLFFAFLLLSISATASNKVYLLKGNFSGIVTDAATGMPLVGVSIFIFDIKRGTSTNTNGAFELQNIPDGMHIVECSIVGYTTIALQININGDTKKDIQLSQAVVESNAVIVTGVSRASQLKKVPFQVAVIRKEELQQTAASNIVEAITKKAGVSSISTGPAISKPVIRGLGYNRVLTLNDGIRQEGQQWGDEHGLEIDEASVQKIEILKGPASLVYGSDAMAGVINIITNTTTEANTIKFNVGSNYQTNNRLKNAFTNMAGNIKGINWNLFTTKKDAIDYKNKYDGYVFNAKFKEKNIGGLIGYDGGWGYSHLIVSNYNLQAGLIKADRNAAGNFIKPLPGGTDTIVSKDDFKSRTPQIPYQKINHFKIAVDNNFKLGNNNLTFNIGFQQNKREEFGNVDEPTKQNLFFDLKTITYASQFHIKQNKGWKPSVGINGMFQNNTNRGAEQLIPNYNLTDVGLFLFAQKEKEKITYSTGVRVDNRSMDVKNLLADNGTVKGNGFKKSFQNFSASTGLAYLLHKNVNTKLNIARAFRAPSIPELASNGAHEGTIRYEYGNTNLKQEISTQLDASVEINTEHLSLNLAGYVNSFSNFIFYRKLSTASGADSLVNVSGDLLTAFTFDQRKASLTGMEATIDIHPHPIDWLHFQNTFSFVQGNFNNAIEGTRNLSFIPAPRLLTEARANFKKAGKNISNLYAKIELDNVFNQNRAFTAYNTETTTSGYTLLNMGVGADVLYGNGILFCTINIAATNIMDVVYQNHMSRLKYTAKNQATGRNGIFNMGRNFSFRVNFPLVIKRK